MHARKRTLLVAFQNVMLSKLRLFIYVKVSKKQSASPDFILFTFTVLRGNS